MTYRRVIGFDREKLEVSRRAWLLGAAAVAAASLGACGRSGPAGQLLRAEVPRAEPPADSPVAECCSGMLTLAQRMVPVSADAGQNWVASPVSIACAFAMARAGASGSTATQIDQIFGFPQHGRDDGFNAITRELATTDGPPGELAGWSPGTATPGPVVSLGNALFTAEGLKVGDAFLRVLASAYGTGARPVDFTSDQATTQINAWVREQTAGRITKLFDRLDPATKLVLANAVYFKGYWAVPFEPDATVDAPFTRADGSRVSAAMLSRAGSVRYAALDGVQAIELPYGGGPFAMLVMLPAPGKRPDEVLDPATLAAVTAAMTEQHVSVSLPRFDIAADVDLQAVLRRLGLTAPFGPDADFSGIAPGLRISQAVHRANITVDEAGTEAAAVTGLAATLSLTAPPTLSFRADRPFAFMIVGGAGRVPLFVGQVHDPTAA